MDTAALGPLHLVRAAAAIPTTARGEAYLAKGDTAQAIANYRKSVELNPENRGGADVLRRLGAR